MYKYLSAHVYMKQEGNFFLLKCKYTIINSYISYHLISLVDLAKASKISTICYYNSNAKSLSN